jgi:DNA-binding NarL/FixJ family response regulator
MRLLLVDDHVIVREGISVLLQQSRSDVRVLQAPDGERALELARAEPDLDAVLLDLVLPGMEGVRVLEAFGREHAKGPSLNNRIGRKESGGRQKRNKRIREWA